MSPPSAAAARPAVTGRTLDQRAIPAWHPQLSRSDLAAQFRICGRAVGESWPALAHAVAALRRTVPRRRYSAVAHLDLSDVPALDATAIGLLDQAFREIDRIGWLFEVTPPSGDAPSAVFVRAAISGQLGWALGTADGR